MKLAIISDVHGNIHALEAVLDDISRQSADGTFNLGDVVSGPMAPGRVIDAIIAHKIPTVRGNHDRWVSEGGALSPVDQFVADALTPEQHGWLKALPLKREIFDDILLCHGTPSSDEAPFIDNWWEGRSMSIPDAAEVMRRAGNASQKLILCGHTHMARTVRLSDGRQIVNPGSVGLQFLAGMPDARYALIERNKGKWSVTFRVVPYDHEAAADLAAANGFGHWRDALTSGWSPPGGLF